MQDEIHVKIRYHFSSNRDCDCTEKQRNNILAAPRRRVLPLSLRSMHLYACLYALKMHIFRQNIPCSANVFFCCEKHFGNAIKLETHQKYYLKKKSANRLGMKKNQKVDRRRAKAGKDVKENKRQQQLKNKQKENQLQYLQLLKTAKQTFSYNGNNAYYNRCGPYTHESIFDNLQ